MWGVVGVVVSQVVSCQVVPISGVHLVVVSFGVVGCHDVGLVVLCQVVLVSGVHVVVGFPGVHVVGSM